MKNIIAIVQRELGMYFVSPVAYVVLTIFLFLSGMFFQNILSQILRATMMQAMQGAQLGQGIPPLDVPGMVSRDFLSSMSVILLFMIPMITMALFSEEKKRGTIELLLTAPVTDVEVILGKFFAAASFFGILLLTTWIPMAVLYIFGHPATGPILTAYLGLFLYSLSLDRDVHFKPDRESNRCRRAEFWNVPDALACQRHGKPGAGFVQGRAVVPFRSGSPG